MAFLLDTSAVSELTKRHPNEAYTAWLSRQQARDTYVATLTIGEIEAGIGLLPSSQKRRRLESWLTDLIAEFETRILSFDVACARMWGRAVSAARRGGRTLPVVDSQLGAIAHVYGLAVVTRNPKHFNDGVFPSLEVLSPWV